MSTPVHSPDIPIRHFRQILVWPLQLMPIREDAQIQNHWELLECTDTPWEEAGHGIGDEEGALKERQYAEFVTFLPYVQRMLYGEGKGRGVAKGGESPIRIFRRSDVRAVRMVFPGRGEEAVRVLDVARVDLYFFYDLDVALMVVEICANDLAFDAAQEILYRFGRSYPTYWTPQGHGGHCFERVQWLDGEGTVLAGSDYENREKYLTYANRYRSPCISAHWEFLLRPLVLHHSDQPGLIRYRLVEYHRMPLCAFLAMDRPAELTQADLVRLAFIAPPGPCDRLPFAMSQLADFEHSYCIDRYWDTRRGDNPGTRLLSSGEAFVMLTSAQLPSYIDGGPSLLEQFRRQYFVIFMLAHLHKAALCMLSDRLVQSLNLMDLAEPASVRRFKRDIRGLKEIFLRFSHRYWFHEVTDQLLAKSLYHLCTKHLGTRAMFDEVGGEIEDMSQYLDSDAIRRQANTVLRLTVVTIFGLIGTVTTGFLGMNLIDETVQSRWMKLWYFVLVFVPTTLLTLYTLARSKRLSDFLDAVSDDRVGFRAKWQAFLDVWRPEK